MASALAQPPRKARGVFAHLPRARISRVCVRLNAAAAGLWRVPQSPVVTPIAIASDWLKPNLRQWRGFVGSARTDLGRSARGWRPQNTQAVANHTIRPDAR